MFSVSCQSITVRTAYKKLAFSKQTNQFLIKTSNFDKQAEKFLITPVKKPKNINVLDITGHAYVVLMPHIISVIEN